MIPADASARFKAATEEPNPQVALHRLAKVLKDEGVSQKELYDFYMLGFVAHRDDADETIYDAIADELDLIGGNCQLEYPIYGRRLGEN